MPELLRNGRDQARRPDSTCCPPADVVESIVNLRPDHAASASLCRNRRCNRPWFGVDAAAFAYDARGHVHPLLLLDRPPRETLLVGLEHGENGETDSIGEDVVRRVRIGGERVIVWHVIEV